jgi:hypothetical protein
MRTAIWIFLLLTVATACASGPSKAELDAEVRRLCAIDGGVRVYETVNLPLEKFDRRGSIAFFHPSRGEDALGPDYIYRVKDKYYKKNTNDGVAMWRTYVEVIRRSDMKKLGESVSYTRQGGDVPGPWHPSSYICPQLKDLNLLERVFIGPR